MLLDIDARVSGLQIRPNGALVFPAQASAKLTSSGNVVVEGRLVMRPGLATAHHVLTFVDIDEARCIGGGMDVLPTDVGLWIVHSGQLDLEGSHRTSWMRTNGSALAGDRSLTLKAPPVGWLPDDELQVVPTLPASAGELSWRGYDQGFVAAARGPRVELQGPLQVDHPAIASRYNPEVLNLTRNVRIEGEPDGRAHIMFAHITKPQRIRNVAIRWMGPRQGAGEASTSVVGRYGLHFHLCGDGSRGSLVENVVIRDAGAHAFVPHSSHGVTFLGCISHDTLEEPYWWDNRADRDSDIPRSDDIVWERCVASAADDLPSHQGFRLSGFVLRDGTGNRCLNSVAVGVRGNKNASGFIWPEGSQDVWEFHGNAAHNNKVNGLFVWQNNGQDHLIKDVDCYCNGTAGIEQGAYLTAFRYEDVRLVANGLTGIHLHSHGRPPGQVFRRVVVDGLGEQPHAVLFDRHKLEPGLPTLFEACAFANLAENAVVFPKDSEGEVRSTRQLVDFVYCDFAVPTQQAFFLDPDIHPDSTIRVQPAAGKSFVLHSIRQPGELISDWNARRSFIVPFS